VLANIRVTETNFMPHGHRSMVQAFATRSIRTICVMSVLLLHQHTCSSQESPMIGATKFDYNATYRANVCERQQLLYNDTIQPRDALQGLNLSVYITDYSNKPDESMTHLPVNPHSVLKTLATTIGLLHVLVALIFVDI
jgi:hypothetical protein